MGYSSAAMWICCACGDGPKVFANQPVCVACNHAACGGNSIPFVTPQHYHPDTSLPGRTKADLETYRQDWLYLRESLGEEHESTLCVGFRIAKGLVQGKRHELASRWYRYVYLAEVDQLGGKHRKVLEVGHAIADVLTSLGRVKDAERWRHEEGSGCLSVC
ncbi:hypothetical protein BDV19DRAFT_370165 [Aspergillus venezuelensis]